MLVRIKFRTDASLSHGEFSDGNGGACERGGTIGRLEPDAAWGACEPYTEGFAIS